MGYKGDVSPRVTTPKESSHTPSLEIVYLETMSPRYCSSLEMKKLLSMMMNLLLRTKMLKKMLSTLKTKLLNLTMISLYLSCTCSTLRNLLPFGISTPTNNLLQRKMWILMAMRSIIWLLSWKIESFSPLWLLHPIHSIGYSWILCQSIVKHWWWEIPKV